MDLHEKNKPTSPELWDQAISKAKSKFDVYPSAYANAWAAKEYKKMGGEWTKESVDPFLESVIDNMVGDIANSIKNQLKRKTGNKSVKAYAEKAHESVRLAEQRFSQSMIDKMRKEYGNIGTIDPSQPTYKRLTALLDKLTDEQLKQLAQAKIKFVSSLALNRVNRRKMQKESVELDEATRTAFKGGDRSTADFQRKLKEMGMAQEYMKMVRLLKKKGSGFGLFMKEEDRGEEYASKTGLGPSLGFSIEKVNGEKLGSEDVQKRGDTTYKKTLVAMNESVMTESINPKDIDPTGYYAIYSNRITGPYSSEKKAYYDGRGDLDDILTGAELIKKLKKGKYKKSSLRIRESVELDEVYGRDPQGSHIPRPRKGKKFDTSLEGLRRRRLEYEAKAAQAKKEREETNNESVEEDWQSVNRKDNVDGLSQKAVDAYRRENPGSKLQTAVTEKNPKGKRAARRSSFCSRMKGMKSKLTSAETANDPDSRINKALRRWNCR